MSSGVGTSSNDPAFPKAEKRCSLHITTVATSLHANTSHTVVVHFPSEYLAKAGRDELLKQNDTNARVTHFVVLLRDTLPN